MKKIFAILISLLFLGSIVGITSLSANGLTVECYFDKSIVHRGEYVTYTIKLCNHGVDSQYVMFLGGGSSSSFLEFVSTNIEFNTEIEIKPGECFEAKFVFIATDFGEINEFYPCGCISLKVLPKSLPMQQFMKILGFGQKD
ncbi:MAG: hypothetical protein ABFD15_01090 [Methanofastidiosum sp.]